MIYSILFIALAGIAKGLMDANSDKGSKAKDWVRKYDFDKKKNHWWYFGCYTPKYSERFPFSTTVLVFLTDRWHMYQMIMLRFIYLSISIQMTDKLSNIILLTFLAFPVLLGIPFQITYTIVKSK